MKEQASLTLREGIDRFYKEHDAPRGGQNVSPEANQFFLCHDTAHVVFGCDTSFFGEGIVKIFTIWGTTLGFRGHLAGYSDANAFSLFRQYRLRHLVKNFARLVLTAPRAIIRARRMSKPWPWSDHQHYLDKPISDIRREFNIQVFEDTETQPPSP